MNLFKTLSEVLGNGCTATITIAQKDGIMTVGVLPGNNLEKNKILLNDVWSQIDLMPEKFKPIAQVLGYYYYCEVYKYKGIDMVTESANLAAIDPQKAKAPNTVFEMVFHPNGNLNGSWIEDEDVLLPYAGGSRICYSNRIK